MHLTEEILAEARQETGLPVVTEIMDPADVDVVAEHADMFQIGTRNMQNFPLLQAVGALGQPGDLAASGVTVLQALGGAVGLAAGATLGTYLGRPVKAQLRRIRNLPRPRLRSIPEESQQTGE